MSTPGITHAALDNDSAAIEIHLLQDLSTWLTEAPRATAQWVAVQQFTGAPGKHLFVPATEQTSACVLVGCGETDDLGVLGGLPLTLPEAVYRLSATTSELNLLGWALGAYQYTRYKAAKRTPATLLIEDAQLYKRIERFAEATTLTRDLINTPANDMLPSHLEAASRALAAQYGAEIEVTTGAELLSAGYNTIHAVGRASVDAPRLIDLRWGNVSEPLITLIGKGVCFDSGGLNIKPAGGMRTMKKDMGGAAQVLGLARLIMDSNLPIRLRVLVSAVENAISSNAYRPGDILRTYKGITVEIDNTDAEGRLVLCDALALACEDNPELVVDYATLTGSARSAVGAEIAAMFCNDNAIANAVFESGDLCDDAVWRLPLHKPYKAMLRSTHADTVNSASSPFAGAVTAALFLEQFIDPGINWLHFDLMAWNPKNRPGHPEGGEAMGVRAVYHYLENRYG